MSRAGVLRRPIAASLVLALAATSVVVGWAVPAAAGQATFVFTGAAQVFTVPAGVTRLAVTLAGAPGAAGAVAPIAPVIAAGGSGALVSADLAVSPGDTLYVLVGGAASAGTGGFNGGGNPAASSRPPGGGGGATDIRSGGSALTDRVIVAGGGGGGGAGGSTSVAGGGGAGGAIPADGINGGAGNVAGGKGGRAGTSSAGGAGGAGGDGVSGDGATGVAGSSGTGGAGGFTSPGRSAGGAGGGGYFGGGGAGSGGWLSTTYHGGGGGGAGSNLTTGAGVTNASVAADTEGTARVTITYADPPSVTALGARAGPAAGGTSVTITGVGFAGATQVSFGGTPAGFVVHGDTSLTATSPAHNAGDVHITVTGPSGTSATGGADLFTYLVAVTVGLAASTRTPTFGDEVTLTSTLSPGTPTGTVTYSDVPATGPSAAQTVTLGTVPAGSGLTVTLPSFGSHRITARYNGDSANAAGTSAETGVEVRAAVGGLIVRQFRSFGPDRDDDQFVELYNTGPAFPLAGFTVLGGGAVSVLPGDAPTLATGQSYLLTGPAYSLSPVAEGDLPMDVIGMDGVRVEAPDTAGTVTDAVGTADGDHSGTALPAMAGTPAAEYAWTRVSLAGVPQDTRDNLDDFALVSTTGGEVGGVPSMLGAPRPASVSSPRRNAALRSTLLDPSVSSTVEPNRTVVPGVSGDPGRLIVRRTITNTSATAVSSARLVITSLSQVHGPPRPGVSSQPAVRADLRVVNPGTPTSEPAVTGGGTVVVRNLSVALPTTDPPGGGLSTMLTVPLPSCQLAPNASVNIAVTFTTHHAGTYWLGYNVETTAAPPARAARCRADFGRRTSSAAAVPAGAAAAGDSGRLG